MTQGIPGITRARVSITPGAILITGRNPVRDPLLDLRLAVNCPYTPTFVREFTLIVDTAAPETFEPVPVDVSEPAAPQQPIVATTPATPEPVAAPEPAAPAVQASPEPEAAPAPMTQANAPAEAATPKPQMHAADLPIFVGDEYPVMRGDTTSSIISRIEGRTMDMGSAIATLVAANPDAFLEGDANRLMSDVVLVIPDMSAAATTDFERDVVEPEPVVEPAAADAVRTFGSGTVVAPPEPEPAPVAEEPAPVVETPEPVAETPAPVAEIAAAEEAVAEAPRSRS